MDLQTMSAWSDLIAAVSGVVAALGVMGSLLFVGIQLRNQNREARLQSISSVTRDYRQLSEASVNDPEIASIFIRMSRQGFDGMDDTTMFRGQLIYQSMMRFMEDAFFQYSAGLLDERVWSSIERGLDMTIGSIGFDQYWTSRGSWYSVPFQSYINEKKATAGKWLSVMEDQKGRANVADPG